MNPKAYRLPKTVLPRRYDISLEARLGERDYGGSVSIALDLLQPGNSIELHARDLQIPHASVTADGQAYEGAVELDGEREIARLTFPDSLPAGPATLLLEFRGQLNGGLQGLYLAKDGPEQLLCTQCEATDARAIFPCFDEPTFKAQFAWEITTAADSMALANTPLVSTKQDGEGGSKTWSFAPSKPMSSYLVALVIGDVAGTDEEIVNGTPIRVWALRGKEHMCEFAHRYTTRLLPWYEEYFGAPYHFDKYDQVAVPGFAAGAMENSGLVLFRQPLLLMEPETASWQQEKAITHVVAHEFAHMWFGNLVTMRWWDDLWLNEAFAEWVSVKAVNALSPEYKLWDDFQASKAHALRTDALESTHPIYTPVATAGDAEDMFDAITYIKGCAVLRMLENFLGEDAFRAGLCTYMREFAESNAAGADLWRHLQQASQEPVTAIIESWIMQSGHPVIHVALEGSKERPEVRLSQRRFYSNPQAPEATSQLWQVPMVIRYEDAAGVHERRYLLAEREAVVPLEASGAVRWLYANADEVGFYRQSFDEALLSRLRANLDQLAPSEQMRLLNDQWGLTRSGAQSIGQFLDLLTAMARIDHYNVVGQVVGHMHDLERMLHDTGDTEAVERFREWVGDTFQEKLAELGFEPRAGEGQNEAQQRRYVLDAMATLAEDEEAVYQVEQWARREAEDPEAVDANLADLVVSAAARFGDAERFDRYVEIYQQRRAAQATPQETNRYLYSFASFRLPELVARTLRLMEDQVVPQESFMPLLRQMLPRRHTQGAAWEYMKEHWESMKLVGALAIGALVEGTGNLPASMRDDVVAFFDAHLDGQAPMSYARALETMDQMAEFQARTRDDLLAWFKNR